ncbi:MAG: class I SAM-dependent methyltransferase [Mariprofundaceae bacterium]|nr:class I SAM-dependent methyltransferase [Mariprofundaceae bacterium]
MGNDSAGSHESWDINSINPEREMTRLYGMAGNLTVRHVKQSMEKLPKNCLSIEIGSGLGKMSFFPALLGSDVHLLDSSSAALKAAESLYNYCGIPVKTHECDALSLPSSLLGKFDLSLSLGVNEHFSGELRQSIFDVHHDVLKSGGRAVIAVPNRHCISYRIAMLMWKLTGRWPEGLYEYGFSRSELMHRMKQAGFTEVEVVSGTYAKDDFQHFIMGNLKAALQKFGLMHQVTRVDEKGSDKPCSPGRILERLLELEAPEVFNNHQSYAWVAKGRRS